MRYPKTHELSELLEQIIEYTKLKTEYESDGVESFIKDLKDNLKGSLDQIKTLAINDQKSKVEPDKLSEIRLLRPEGPRRLWGNIKHDVYKEKLEGALLSRIAGCILGAPVEFHSVEAMENWAEYTDQPFPPVDYWYKVKSPNELRYEKSDFITYTKEGMTKAPVDDDITYTLLGLLLVEEYGHKFTTKDVGVTWLKYLPYGCTAEKVALENLKNGVDSQEVAEINNPYCQWIGADIRSDAFAYIAPGWPEKAAEMAYYDAYLSHRRNGIYGEMFFAAAQSAAFAVDHPIKAIEIGLSEIPENCDLAIDVRWALDMLPTVQNYKQARELVNKRFDEMSHAHTNNNACLTIFGLHIGQLDVTKTISEIVAMGMDNDCTAATAGSIIGAIVGKQGVDEHWYKNFNNVIDHYLIDLEPFLINNTLDRFQKQAEACFAL